MSEQLTLPYEQIEKVASRDFLRNNKSIKTGGRVTYKTAFKNLSERDGFNSRTLYDDIENFADFIFINGLPEPFTLDILPDGRALIEQGHRRFRAINLLIKQNRFSADTEVEFWVNSSSVTELQRMVKQFTSNNHQKPLPPIDQATVAFNVKYNFGEELSNEKVAELFGVSRQTIDNLLIIAKAPDDVKNQVRLGTMSFTDAVAFVRSQKKQGKVADQKEEESHITSMDAAPLPKDELKEDIKDLELLEEQAKEYREKVAEKEKRDLERLHEVANEVLPNKEDLTEQLGKRFARPVYHKWEEDFADEDTGEIVSIERSQLILGQEEILDEEAITLILNHKVGPVFIYKQHTIAPSVLTPFIEDEKESKGFDEDRPEIAQIQNCIKLADKIEAVVNKLDCPEGTKTDIANFVKWMQKDLAEVRQWIHTNKKQNKMR